jgi:hypothetical protein
MLFSMEKQADLLETLKKTQVMGHTAWETDYPVKRPWCLYFQHGARTLLGAG